MLKKHPEVIKRIREHDFSDIYNDPVLTIGEKYVKQKKKKKHMQIPMY